MKSDAQSYSIVNVAGQSDEVPMHCFVTKCQDLDKTVQEIFKKHVLFECYTCTDETRNPLLGDISLTVPMDTAQSAIEWMVTGDGGLFCLIQ